MPCFAVYYVRVMCTGVPYIPPYLVIVVLVLPVLISSERVRE